MLCEGRQKSSEKTLRQQNEYLALLHQTALSLVNQLDLDAVLNRIVISAARLVGTPNGCIFLLDKDKGIFIRTHGVGVYEHDIGATRTLEEGLIGIVYKTAAPAQVGQYSGWQKRVLSPIVDQIHAMLQVPLKSGHQVVGAIGLAYLEDGETFGEEEVEILSRFAELASIALENARLHTAQQAELAERQKAEEALISSEANNKALLAAVPDTIFRFNRQGVLLDFRLGREPVSWILPAAGGSSISAVMSPQMAQNILRHALLAEQSGGIMEFEYSVGDGTAWEVRIGTSGRGEFLAIVRNVTERREMQSRLEYLSMHDALTGLFNRYRFEQEMFRLSKGGGRAGMIICDVDGLKFINDSLGHEAGDALLKTTGTILREVFAAEDIAARVGGDEFAILLPNRSHSEVEQDCRRLQKSVDSHNRENPGLPLSISIGFAASSEELAEMSSLYKEADNYMYREKLHRKTSIRSSIVQALMKAMEVRDYATQGHAHILAAGGLGCGKCADGWHVETHSQSHPSKKLKLGLARRNGPDSPH